MTKGTFTFKWSQPAESVYVTGSFDNWAKTAKLEKAPDGSHIGVVELPIEKTTYKFVVDDDWTFDQSQRVETDASGNFNNYLLVEDIAPKDEPVFSIPRIPDTAHDTESETVTPLIQSSGAESSTAALAAEVPLEPKKEKAKEPAPEPDTVSALPIVESESTFAVSSVGPEATTAALAADVPLEAVAKQEPIVPEATKAIVAPEDLPTPDPRSVPGFLPDTFDEGETDQVVSIDPIPASETATNPIHLEPNEPVPPHTASVTDNVKLDKESYEHADASNLGVGATAAAAFAAVTGAISSAVGSTSETVKNLIPESVLPIATKPEVVEDHSTATTEVVPPVVLESQSEAHVEPEASANPVAVEAKKEVEDEIVAKIEKAAPEPVTVEAPHADVPETVRESQVAAGVSLEASASPVAVEAKKEIEAELKSEVKPAEPIAEEPTTKPSEPEAVPAVVTASIEKAGESAEAAANPVAVEAKAAVEAAITKGETKPEPLEPPTKEEGEPSTVEKVAGTAAEAAEKVAEKVTPEAPTTEAPPPPTTEAPPPPTTETPAPPTTEAPAPPKTDVPEVPKTDAPEPPKTEEKNGEASASAAAAAAKDKDIKKKRRVSAFFHKIAQKLK